MEAIGYCPTGKFTRLRLDQSHIMTNKWFVRYDYRGNNLLIGATKLGNKEGEITLGEDDWFSVPTMEHDILPIFALDGDTMIVTTSSKTTNLDKILTINLDTRQHEEYPHLNIKTYGIGIDGDVVYLAYHVNSGRMIGGFNLKTREMVFEYPVCGLLRNGGMHKIYDGRRVIGRVRQRPGKKQKVGGNLDVYEIVSVPDGEVLLQIKERITETKITQCGVFYVSKDGDHCYSTFDGETYLVNIEADQESAAHDKQWLISTSSDDAQSIWISFYMANIGNYFVNYRLSQRRRQKSSRF